MLSKLIFKSLYPFCSPNTKIILGSMNDKADVIQRCIDEQLNHQLGDYKELSTENFRRWVKILEAGTFNPIDQIAINVVLYSHKRMATKKIICSTLIDGGYTSKEEDYRDHPDPEMDEYCGQLEGHLKGYPGYEDEPIHPHYGDDPTQELIDIINDFDKDFGEENQCK